MTTSPQTPRPCFRRLALSAVAALALGVVFAVAGGYALGTFIPAQETTGNAVYLSSIPAEEDMLRTLSEQLMQADGADATALSDIAPAAGEPLGTFSP